MTEPPQLIIVKGKTCNYVTDPKTLTLENNSRVTGTGQFRTPGGWTDFSFTCDLDPQTGKVTSFQPVLANVAH